MLFVYLFFNFGLWVMLAGSSGEELLGRVKRWERREKNRFFFFLYIILFDCVIYIFFIGIYVKIETGM